MKEISDLSKILEKPWIPKVVMGKKEKFSCPVCGGTEYGESTESNGILGPGGSTWMTYHFCLGCTVMFKDPVLFTKK